MGCVGVFLRDLYVPCCFRETHKDHENAVDEMKKDSKRESEKDSKHTIKILEILTSLYYS